MVRRRLLTGQSERVTDPEGRSVLDVADAFGAACNAHDLDAAIGLCADDVVFESTEPPDGARGVGRTVLREVWAPIFDNAASHVEVEETIVAGDRVVQRVRYSWGDG